MQGSSRGRWQRPAQPNAAPQQRNAGTQHRSPVLLCALLALVLPLSCQAAHLLKDSPLTIDADGCTVQSYDPIKWPRPLKDLVVVSLAFGMLHTSIAHPFLETAVRMMPEADTIIMNNMDLHGELSNAQIVAPQNSDNLFFLPVGQGRSSIAGRGRINPRIVRLYAYSCLLRQLTHVKALILSDYRDVFFQNSLFTRLKWQDEVSSAAR